jgi:hypothetical protein
MLVATRSSTEVRNLKTAVSRHYFVARSSKAGGGRLRRAGVDGDDAICIAPAVALSNWRVQQF